MLRRKLLLNLGPLVGLLLLTAVAAIWFLQGILARLNHVSAVAWSVVDDVNALSITVNEIERDLYQIQLGQQRHLDGLIEAIESSRQLVERIGRHYLVHEPACAPLYQSIVEQMPMFEQHVGVLATVQEPSLARQHGEAALNAAVALRRATLPLSRYVRDHAYREQTELTTHFRNLVLGLAAVFLVVINVSVMVLLRMGSIVVRPVEKLVAATRLLGAERFDCRIELDQHDEFDELARAYNSLAEQLQANERKRIETLGQVAVTINHELNNAIAIIDLQLAKLSRQTTGAPGIEKCLREIHESLERVTRTVQSLKNVRRIVLTDYVPGTKMLDLRRSVEQEGQQHGQQPADLAASQLQHS
ncbi:HAMP domain-containing protein [Fontivita pretiosa]|uniref:HAMP domain-containing protein n=1 Tax=Fontivita pretiosa TaxID=2989684 RepID=UPI003D169581